MALLLHFSHSELVDLINQNIATMRRDVEDYLARLSGESASGPRRHHCCDEEDGEPITPEEIAALTVRRQKRLAADVARMELIRDHLAVDNHIITPAELDELFHGGRF